MAAYVPPHKRNSNDLEKGTPTSASFVPEFKKKLNFGSSSSNAVWGRKIVYADGAISRWFALGVGDDDKIRSSVHLQPVPMEYLERKTGQKPLALMNDQPTNENCEDDEKLSRRPWDIIAVNVWSDLLTSYGIVRGEMESSKLEEVKPTLVARFGKVLFHRGPFGNLGTSNCISTERTLRQLKRSFYTNVPTSYTEDIVDLVVPKIGLDFEEEKDIYHVKLSDNKRPDSTISCKCTMRKDNGKLEFFKIELNQVRQLVVDISCLHKDLDLRLMLCTKRIVPTLTDDEENSIRYLVNSAVLDPSVKGGLRWPLGKATTGDRYAVVGVWHTVARTYNSSQLRLKVRQADRYDFRAGTGETAKEVIVKLKGLVSDLKESKFDADSVPDELKDMLKIIWGHFLRCDRFLR